MGKEWCKSLQKECDPADCNVEMCWWRDNVWAIKQLSRWAYDTSYDKPKSEINKNQDDQGKNKDSES